MTDTERLQLERIKELQRENGELRTALVQVEWVSIAGCDHSMLECPWCGALEYPNRKHKPDCARQLALQNYHEFTTDDGGGTVNYDGVTSADAVVIKKPW